jgi:hypothetical protein
LIVVIGGSVGKHSRHEQKEQELQHHHGNWHETWQSN